MNNIDQISTNASISSSQPSSSLPSSSSSSSSSSSPSSSSSLLLSTLASSSSSCAISSLSSLSKTTASKAPSNNAFPLYTTSASKFTTSLPPSSTASSSLSVTSTTTLQSSMQSLIATSPTSLSTPPPSARNANDTSPSSSPFAGISLYSSAASNATNPNGDPQSHFEKAKYSSSCPCCPVPTFEQIKVKLECKESQSQATLLNSLLLSSTTGNHISHSTRVQYLTATSIMDMSYNTSPSLRVRTSSLKQLKKTADLAIDNESHHNPSAMPKHLPPTSDAVMTKPFPIRAERTISDVSSPLVIAMVGLPARGKTFISKKLSRYLNWIGYCTKLFNLGEYRRRSTTPYKSHEFFRSDNEEAVAIRNRCANQALHDSCEWLLSGQGSVAVFDATNSTYDRRKLIHDIVVKQYGFSLFFVESICDDPDIIEQNIKQFKVSSPDYVNMSTDLVMSDFLQRIEHYEERYQPMDEIKESHLSFMKIYNAGKKVVVYNNKGHVEARIVYYLMNIHITPRTIYLTRNGESEHNLKGLIDGDSNLSERGHLYAKALSAYIDQQQIEGLRVWTSWMKRAIQTVVDIKAPQKRWKALNEINAGNCEEITNKQIKERFPEEFSARDQNKFAYRYPRGESYEDLVERLDPVIMELERQGNVLVVSHQSVLSCLLEYFLDKSANELSYLCVPLHTVIRLTPVAYGFKVEHIKFPINAVDTPPNGLCGELVAPDGEGKMLIVGDEVSNGIGGDSAVADGNPNSK